MPPPTPLALLPRLLSPIALFIAASNAYSFVFNDQPKQCQNLSLSITGNGGQPPYRVVIIPFGPSPLPNNVEVRTIQDRAFDGDSTSISFQLAYPQNSQFVAVVSDSSGFGSGGTSVAATVLGSSDSSCFNATNMVQPAFSFSIDPPNQLVQCNASRLYWFDGVQGTPQFQGVIPGGNSFSIPIGQTSQQPNEGTGFQWVPPLRSGTTMLLVAGDQRGIGSGGSEQYGVAAGQFPSSSCLNSTSPSSTPGSPAGGSYPTNADGSSTTGGSGGGSSPNIGAIVGGTIGGVAAIAILALLAFFLIRRRTAKAVSAGHARPVDLLHGEREADERDGLARGDSADGAADHFYRPEPFLAAAPSTVAGGAGGAGDDARSHRSSHYISEVGGARAGTPTESGYGYGVGAGASAAGHGHGGDAPAPSGSTVVSSSRKSAAGMRQLRPVNIIQHDDAGVVPAEEDEHGEGEEEPETVELPPAYTNIRRE
ncbi:hypothetical protein CONPUDRAFT_167389 [Coniophora puteana RWD-64-598 SS2]|uniref:Uncharacterized protein n=1 Tax=Coniophora puteana (strain RWD-64-598) TaxID=741705 RepID=A0A5M3MH82_CONPW|nr:uncharacterized protein CONPUDRAFT_167389 [Coniophora puteana RWD-64-598 SS2]EIW78366.1 hypothetical protein CONPUDRAFT_167389 [Coniophora puteana RWD-64-598 SS2]